MLLQPVVDHITATVGAGVLAGGFRKVAGAADFASARIDLKNPPAAYVIPLGDRAMPNEVLGLSIEQHVIERFGVVLAVSNAKDARGDAVNSPLETLRRATIDNMIGFQPATGYDPVNYGGGRILTLDATMIWWQLEFITGYYERKV